MRGFCHRPLSRYNDAEKYANNFNHLLKQHKITSPLWLERAGNAALFAKDYSNAERKYKSALKAQKNRSSSLPKLADVYFLENRVEEEREVRESIYGVLNYE